MEKKEVVMNTPRSATFFGSSTDGMQIAVITIRLKQAEPTIVDGPSSPAFSPRPLHVSMTARRISGAEDPKAIKVRFAIVAFQTGVSIKYELPSLSNTSYLAVVDVIFSMAAMKRSAIIAIPKKRYSKKNKYTTPRNELLIS